MAGSIDFDFLLGGREVSEQMELERLLRLEVAHKFRMKYGGTCGRRMTEGEIRTLEYLQKKYLGG